MTARSRVPPPGGLTARHVQYGARPEHYPVVGGVLIASMEELARDDWTPAYTAAWSSAFEIVAGAMLEGAGEALQRAA
jgi:hemoglobin-like flavoprotein